MRSHLRRAVSIAAIGVIALLAVPAHVRDDAARIAARDHAAQLTTITLPTADAPSPAPRGRTLDLSFAGVVLAAAFSIALLRRVMRSTLPYGRRDVRALTYGRLRGPPFALA